MSIARRISAQPRSQSPMNVIRKMASLLPSSGLNASARSPALRQLLRVLAEEQRHRECLLGQVVGRRDIHGTPRGRQRTLERAGPRVVAMAVLVRVDPRQHRPAIGIGRRHLDRALQHVARRGMFAGAQAMVIAEASHQRFVGRELRGVLAANGFADATREHSEVIGAGRDDARDQLVLQREDLIGLEPAGRRFPPTGVRRSPRRPVAPRL